VAEVQFFVIPVRASDPVPLSGAGGIAPDAVVSWQAGRESDQHTIYISTDPNAVADGLTPSVTSNTNSLDLTSLDLNLGETYYWRVDEVNETETPPVWTGPVWSFGTLVALIVDDFESYSNFSPDRPFQTWLDGYGYSANEFFPVAYEGNGTGSSLGHSIWTQSSPHFEGQLMEMKTTIPGSSQSMPLYYSNTGNMASQIDRHWSAPQDWSAHGIQTLVLHFHGSPGNTGQLYVKINDTKISYDGDASNLTELKWNAWDIDLSSRDVSSVNTLSIGIDGAGANGMLLLDDIGLYKSAPEMPATEGR